MDLLRANLFVIYTVSIYAINWMGKVASEKLKWREDDSSAKYLRYKWGEKKAQRIHMWHTPAKHMEI